MHEEDINGLNEVQISPVNNHQLPVSFSTVYLSFDCLYKYYIYF
jgi:hypothetical protein